mmetsp:Transcript_1584/g.2788  ORF Transcript_1584/g.2788 Transcript_1584/m.2788 type:complete len:266 (-) Transcript_1584:104-901(-)
MAQDDWEDILVKSKQAYNPLEELDDGEEESKSQKEESVNYEGELVEKVDFSKDLSLEILHLTQLKIDFCSKMGGSLTFLRKYVSHAIKRLRRGPRRWVDPEQDFIEKDKILYCQDNFEEVIKDQLYQCKIDKCSKGFNSERNVIKHILKKHKDKIQEAYEQEKTKKWISRRVKEKIKKEMKKNYERDENKLFTQQGRRYDRSETSYYAGGGGDDASGQGRYGRGGKPWQSRGRGNRYFVRDDYVDFDNPTVNEQQQKVHQGDNRD